MLPGSWLQVWPQIRAAAQGVVGQFARPTVAIYWGYLLSAALLACCVHAWRQRSAHGLFEYLLPRAVWLHRSTLADFALFVLNTLIYSFGLLAPLAWVSQTLASKVWLGLHGWLGPLATPLHGPVAALGLAVVTFVLADLAFFLGHLALHRIPLLWEFHKVHHSAAVLQPMTVMRRHPVSIVVDGLVSGMLLGVAYGCAGWLGGGELRPTTILGTNAVLFVGLLAGFNLQHSHVWLSFGWLDRLLISPATHQLHHSADPAHHDRNFGNFLVVWDRLAGTALLPREIAADGRVPQLQFGLGPRGGEWEREYGKVWRLYLWPLWRVLGLRRRTRR